MSAKRFFTIGIFSCAAAMLCLAATFALAIWQSSTFGPDCSGRRISTQPLFPGHSVFTAHLIRVGHSTRASGRWLGDWAIGRVQDRFWGLSSWTHVVLLTNGTFWEGEKYFIDGSPSQGLLARFLPIVEAGPCARTKPIVDATLELHLLRERTSAKSRRLVGYVRRPEPFRPWRSRGPLRAR